MILGSFWFWVLLWIAMAVVVWMAVGMVFRILGWPFVTLREIRNRLRAIDERITKLEQK